MNLINHLSRAAAACALLALAAAASAAGEGWFEFGGAGGDDQFFAACATADGGYALAGASEPFLGGNEDFWVVRASGGLKTLWTARAQNTGRDAAHAIVELPDGNIVVGGVFGKTKGRANDDGALVGLSSTGQIKWQKTFGNGGDDVIRSLVATPDGGLLFALETTTAKGDIKSCMIKTDTRGREQWRVSGPQPAMSLKAFINRKGEYVLACWQMAAKSKSSSTRVCKLTLLKTNARGKDKSTRTWTSGEPAKPSDIIPTADGGYALTGAVEIFSPNPKIFIASLDAKGRQLGLARDDGDSWDEGKAIVQDARGNLIVAIEYNPKRGESQILLLKVPLADGQPWVRLYGQEDQDRIGALISRHGGGYLIAGTSRRKNVDRSRQVQAIAIKTDAEGHGPELAVQKPLLKAFPVEVAPN